MDFSYENERLVLTINCLQELDDIVKETEKRPKKVIVKNGARLTMTKIQQYFRSAMMSEVEEIEIVGGQRLCSVDGIVYTVASKIVMFCPKGRRGVVNVADGTLLVNGSAFLDCKNIEEVILPDSITDIGRHAFHNCSHLKRVKMGRYTKIIRDYAFAGCHSLESVFLGEVLYKIGVGAFNGCVTLKELTLPNTLRQLEKWAFSGCVQLSIKLPERMDILENHALYKIKRLAVHYYSKNTLNAFVTPIAEASVKYYAYDTMSTATVLEVRGAKAPLVIPNNVYIHSPSVINENIKKYLETGEEKYAALFQYGVLESTQESAAILHAKYHDTPYVKRFLTTHAASIFQNQYSLHGEEGMMNLIQMQCFTNAALSKMLQEAEKEGLMTVSAYLMERLKKRKGGDKFKV